MRINRKAANRAQAASKQGRIGEGGGEGFESLKTTILDSARGHQEERAAIIEFDGGMTRAKAESMALREVAKRVNEVGE